MKIINLGKDEKIYCCNRYLILGSWNQIDAVNTIIDVGTNGSIVKEIEKINKGVGKKPVEQVILTHNHFDHAGGLKEVIDRYRPVVYAYTEMAGVNKKLYDGMSLILGDREFNVIYIPGHSNDSICLYCKEEGILFSGDSPLNIKTPGGSYSALFVKVLERLARLDIKTIYSGHDDPVEKNAIKFIRNTLENVRKSRVI